MRKENKIVHGLWIGDELSNLELLTLNSFLQNGHDFHLWLYDSLKTRLPEGITVKDANQILPRNAIFRYRLRCPIPNEDRFMPGDFGEGSLAGFSDVFRYRLLYEQGGWWSDMDNTCLKPLDFEEPYVFKYRLRLGATGNLMKCPARSPLMQRCFERTRQEVDENNTEWLKPIRILVDSIKELGLEEFIREGISNYDVWEDVEPFLKSNAPMPESFYVFHWSNEVWRSLQMDKNGFNLDSTYASLLHRFNVTKLK